MIQATDNYAPSSLMKLGQAAQYLQWDIQKLRRFVDAPESPIRTIRLDSGHRLIVRASLEQLVAPEEPASSDEGTSDRVPVLLLARVSSEGQARKRGRSEQSDLQRQITRLREYQRAHYPNAEVHENFSVRSGCNFQHKSLHDALRIIWSGRLRGGVLLATYFDRVLRIGWELIELACQEFGVKIVYICKDMEEDEDENSLMVSELLSIMTLFTARASGAKARANLKVFMSPELLRRTWELHLNGVSIVDIAEMYRKEKIVDEKGRAYTKHIIRTLLIENRKQLTALYGAKVRPNIEVFMNTCVKKCKDGEVEYMTLYKRYVKWARQAKVTPLSSRKAAPMLRKLGWKCRKNQFGRTAFVGVALDTI